MVTAEPIRASVAVIIPLNAPRVISVPTPTESLNVEKPVTSNPSLAVTNPMESILVTSSYVSVPAMDTSPLKDAPVAVINPTSMLGSP